MHQMHVFLHLERKEQLFLLEALAVVVAVRLGLWLLPFQKLRALVTEIGQRPIGLHSRSSVSIDRIAWSVRAVSRYVPRATCLTQALSGKVLLARRGHPTRLHIGVAKKSHEGLEAHAWLECEGQIVLGDHGFLAVYAAFPSLE
jgi:hypothetical protein